MTTQTTRDTSTDLSEGYAVAPMGVDPVRHIPSDVLQLELDRRGFAAGGTIQASYGQVDRDYPTARNVPVEASVGSVAFNQRVLDGVADRLEATFQRSRATWEPLLATTASDSVMPDLDLRRDCEMADWLATLAYRLNVVAELWGDLLDRAQL